MLLYDSGWPVSAVSQPQPEVVRDYIASYHYELSLEVAMTDPAAEAARSAAAILAPDLDPSLPAEVEAALAARDSQDQPPRHTDPISLASLIVSIATLAWTIYKDRRNQVPSPPPDSIARQVRITLREQDISLSPGVERITEIVAVEITRQTNTFSGTFYGPVVQARDIAELTLELIPASPTALKAELPHPYNQDLSGVLRHLNSLTASGQAMAANDPTTAAYLVAAIRLIQRHLGPVANRLLSDLEGGSSVEEPLIKLLSPFLSRREVAAEVAHNPEPFLRLGSVATLRSRWTLQSDFIADLLNFASFYHVFSASPEPIVAADQAVFFGSNLPGGDDGVFQASDQPAPESPLHDEPRLAWLRRLSPSGTPGDSFRVSKPNRRHWLQPALRAAGNGWGTFVRAVIPIDALAVLRSSQADLQLQALALIETELDHAYMALGPPPGVEGIPR